MAKYNLNMSVNHCPNWGFWESIREILQNGDDEQKENPNNIFSVNYYEEKSKIILKNKESSLEKESLLIGHSTKRENGELTGKYGEGYKVALAVLSRLGKSIVIKNYRNKEKWTVIVEDKVVKVDITKFMFKSVTDHNLTWEITGVTKEEWKSIQSYYLPFIKDLKSVDTYHGKLILNKELIGNVYVNNLFIENFKDLSAAYSLNSKDVVLDRDRKTLKMFDLQYITGQILSSAKNKEKESSVNIDLVQIMKSKKIDTKYIASWLNNDSISEIKKDFISEYSDKAYPVSSQTEYVLIKENYPQLNPIIVNETILKVIVRDQDYKTPESLLEKLDVIIEKNEITPYSLMLRFYMENKDYMIACQSEFKELLELSKNWKNNSNDYNAEASGKIEEKVELEVLKTYIEKNYKLGAVEDFDDDIPF